MGVTSQTNHCEVLNMSFFQVSKKAEDVKQSGGNHIVASGIYPVTILAAVVSTSVGGSESVDLFIDHNGQKQIIYGNLRITNNDGTPNKIGAKVFNQLMIISETDSVEAPVENELPIASKGAMKTVAVLEGIPEVDILLRIQMEFGAHKGNITEKKVIKAFFRADDKASAEEIVNETEAGKGYEREMKYVNNVTYNDGVTPEQAAAWIAAQRPKGTAGSSGSAAKAPAFGKKRFGSAAE